MNYDDFFNQLRESILIWDRQSIENAIAAIKDVLEINTPNKLRFVIENFDTVCLVGQAFNLYEELIATEQKLIDNNTKLNGYWQNKISYFSLQKKPEEKVFNNWNKLSNSVIWWPKIIKEKQQHQLKNFPFKKVIISSQDWGLGDSIMSFGRLDSCGYIETLLQSGIPIGLHCHLQDINYFVENIGNKYGIEMHEYGIDEFLYVEAITASITFELIYQRKPIVISHFFEKKLSQKSKIGICWCPRKTYQATVLFHNNRFIALPIFNEYLLKQLSMSWVNLQVDIPEEEQALFATLPITDYSQQIHSLADTEAIIKGLDLVITVDSAVAHLAGSLGKETWLLLPTPCEWRWGTPASMGDSSVWYPSVRLFRQTEIGDWPSVLTRVREALQQRLNNDGAATKPSNAN